MGIEQKVAVITGASQGIGAALVKAYRDRNYRVVATARSVKPLSDADVLVVPGDIADRKTAERTISEGMVRFGHIDTLVNNAGIFIAKPFTQYTEADYAAILGVNLTIPSRRTCSSPPCTRSGAWARSPTSSTRFSTSNRPAS